jgi:IS1 family transposase/lambda repressor-like predicted transcriptional regulator
VQRYRCHNCNATFSAPRPRVGNHLIDFKKAEQIISLLVEGMSIRAISRLTGVDQNTIMSLLLTVGEKCRNIFNNKVHDIKAHYVELDELWCFVHTKEKRLHTDDPSEWGDTYTWIGLDAQSKLIISYLVAKRDGPSALEFVTDLSKRVIGRLQVTSDAFRPYVGAMEECFGADVDFAQLIKVYGKPDNAGPDWYGPPKVIETVPTPIMGNPDLAHVSTSYVERGNLSVRMHLRRFTRLTNAFSKKLTHLKAAVDLYALWYNMCRIHQTLRVTPAMQAGITDHVWSISELLTA